jgi:YidC/Oxa1 family membrane protein insertase
MEKRIFIAIIVSIAVLWIWAAVAPKLFPELAKKPPVTETRGPAPVKPAGEAPAATQVPATTSLSPASPVAPVAAAAEQLTVVDRPDFRAVFTNHGAQLVSFILKNYKEKHSAARVDLVKPLTARRVNGYPFALETAQQAVTEELNSALYAVTESDDRGTHVIEYRYASPSGLTATKTFRFGAQPYLFNFAVQLPPTVAYRVAIGPGIRKLEPHEIQNETRGRQVMPAGNGVIQADGKFRIVRRDKAAGVSSYQPIDYIGLEDNYFLTVLRPSRGADGVLSRIVLHTPDDKKGEVPLPQLRAGVNAVGGAVAGEAFFGPKETKLLDGYGFGEALQFGWFGIIGRFFLKALVWINQATHNYGWAIVVLTILIKIVLYPLQHKSIVSMKKMQRVQPKVEAIKAKYKKSKTDAEQRQKMNVEMMGLYQKEGINPMAGCLPIVLQLPILWGFYGLLSRAIELRGAPFILWIHDLSEKDPYYITPILMTATMFIQTLITPSTADPVQRRMFLFMPLIFGFFFKDFPSGLVLYWLVQNILTIVQQTIMNKWWKQHPDELVKA